MFSIDLTDAQIVAGWIAYHSRGSNCDADDEDPNWECVEALWILEDMDPARVLELSFQIAKATDDPLTLACLGAGPLEHLLCNDHTLIDAIAIETAASPNLAVALGSVWGWNSIPPEAYATVRRLAGWKSP